MSAGPMRSAATGSGSIIATVFAFVTVLACAPPQSVDRIDPESVTAQAPAPAATAAAPAAPGEGGTLAPSSLPTVDGGSEIPGTGSDAGMTVMIDPGAPAGTPATPVPADPVIPAPDAGSSGSVPTAPSPDAAGVVTPPDAGDPGSPAPARDAGAPDATPVRWAAIIVANPLAPGPADQVVRRNAELRGLKVFWVPDFAVAADVSTATIVVITNGVRRFGSFATFRDAGIPIIVMKSSALDDLDMTGANRSVDYDEEDADDLLIIDDHHPLAAGLHGTLPFAASGTSIAWGHPSATAVRIAGLAKVPAKFVIFGYDKGSAMLTRAAPARRIALLIGDRLSERGSNEANRLLSAAFDWSLR
jgi:hypothetical protein